MPATSLSYRAAVRLGTTLLPAAGLFSAKLRSGVQMRREAGERLLEWSRWNRDAARPLVWFHAPSVGEGLQAQSVLRALRRLRPDCQIIYTHFSPSAEGLARRIEADVSDYLPYDLPEHVNRLLGVLAPDLLVFAKLDVWPELSTRAATTGTAVAIVAATVSPESGRLRWPVRRLLQPGYEVITAAAAIASDDAERLEQLGVARDRIWVLGDPRFDSVADRVRAVPSTEPLLRLGQGAPTMVAGSTWPADETVLLQAFLALLQQRPDARLILVPHEPTSEHLARLDRTATEIGLTLPARLSTADAPAPLLVVDRVGVLAALYGAGSMAYVGGGFGSAGLHSVLEPAAWSLPVAFGPQWRNSRDAALLLEAGAAVALPRSRTGAPARVLQQQWSDWIRDEEGRRTQGRRARSVVERGAGSSARSAQMLVELLGTPTPGGSSATP
jgi:3-deoxy-D-manno-octulosonic-acid transferase